MSKWFQESVINKHPLTPQQLYDWSMSRRQRDGITGWSRADNAIVGLLGGGARGFGDMLSFANAKDTGKAFNEWADDLETYVQPPKQPELSLDYIFSPEGLTRGTAEMLGFMGATLLPTAAVSSPLGAGAKAISQIPKLGRMFNPAQWRAVMHGGASGFLEGGAEGGRFEREAVEGGMDPELARQRSWDVFGKNAGFLGLSNAGQLGAAAKIFSKGMSLPRRAGVAGLDYASQVIEEPTQKAFENAAYGKDYSYNPFNYTDDQMQEVYGVLGPAAILTGVPFGIGAIRNRGNNNNQNEPPITNEQRLGNMRDEVNAAGREVAQNQADNELFTYGNQAPQQQGQSSQNLRNWSHKITDGLMSDEVHNLIVQAADKYGVDRKLALALATAESNGVQLKPNEAGAMGVMQLIPETARGLGVDPTDTAQNIDGGMRYLKEQLDANNGDWRLAAAAYNAGPGAVQKYGGIPPYSETQNYVKRIGELMNSAPADDGGQVQSQGRTSIFGVGDYQMPTQSDRISDQVAALNPAWQSVIPQIGGVLKNQFGMDAVISSAARTPEHNRAVGGVENSHHRTDATEQGGDALDIVLPEGVTAGQAEEIRQYFKDSGLFKEVLFHDVGSGYHLHLGGLQTNKIQSTRNVASPTSQQQTQAPQQVQYQETETKPLFDLNADEDPQVQNIIGNFAEQKYNSSQGNAAVEAASNDIFSGMFDGSGNFKNNKRNRDYIRENYADELSEYVGTDDFALEQADRIIAQKRDAGDFSYQELEKAKAAGDIAGLKRLLQGKATTSQSQQQQAPTTETRSKTPNLDALGYAQNRGMSKWGKRLARALEVAQEKISNNDIRRRTQAMAHEILGNEFGITFKPEVEKGLQAGETKAITEAHKILENNGVFKLNADNISNYAYDYLKDKAEDDRVNRWVDEQSAAEQGLVNVLNGLKNKRENQETADRKYNEIRRGLGDNEVGNAQGSNADVADNWVMDNINARRKAQAEREEQQRQVDEAYNDLVTSLRNEPSVEPTQESAMQGWLTDTLNRYQEQQQREQEETERQNQADEAYSKIRNGLSDEEMGQRQGVNDENSDDYVVKKPDETEKIKQQEEASKLLNRLMSDDEEQFENTFRTQKNTSEDEYLNEIMKNNKAPAKAVKAAVAPISEKLKEREKQAAAVKKVAEANEVELPKPVSDALERGNKKAIEAAQEILREKEVLPPPRNETEVISDNGNKYKAHYEVVDLADLVTSDNKAYPQEWQPRDRDSVELQRQVTKIENALEPKLVMESVNSNQGAPLVNADNVVINGNGRAMGIRGAYEQGKAEHYKQALIDNAERLGLDADKISRLNQPVLVRTLDDEITPEAIQELTQSTAGGARLSASEQAKVDAGKLTGDMLTGYNLNQEGNIDLASPSNREFVNHILGKVTSDNDATAYRQKDGTISKAGIDRVRSALFAKAYGDDSVLSNMVENPDDNVRNVTNALLNAAPKMAQVQIGMERGTLHNYDNLAKDITAAVQKLSSLRNSGTPVKEYLKSQSMFSEYQDSNEMREILKFLDKNKRSAKKISAFLNKIADLVKAQGDPNQTQLFGDGKPMELSEIIKRARESVEDKGQQDIFAAEPEQSQKEELTLPEGYKIESGRSLNESDSKEFIVDEKGNKDFGEISTEIEKATDGIVKAAPIRLQVGNEHFGYIHLTIKHLSQIQSKGFDNAIDYVKHILNNFNQIYNQSHKHKESGKEITRFVLYSKGDKSKGFMPIDLELENDGNDYYTIVTAMPHNEKIKGELVYDESSHSSTAATDGSLMGDTNNKGGDVSPRANAKTNSPAESVAQREEKSKSENAELTPKEIEKAANQILEDVFHINSTSNKETAQAASVDNYVSIFGWRNPEVSAGYINHKGISNSITRMAEALGGKKIRPNQYRELDYRFEGENALDNARVFAKALEKIFDNGHKVSEEKPMTQAEIEANRKVAAERQKKYVPTVKELSRNSEVKIDTGDEIYAWDKNQFREGGEYGVAADEIMDAALTDFYEYGGTEQAIKAIQNHMHEYRLPEYDAQAPMSDFDKQEIELLKRESGKWEVIEDDSDEVDNFEDYENEETTLTDEETEKTTTKGKDKSEKWTDERIDKVVAGDESLANSVKAFNGKVDANGHVTFAKKKDRKNFIKHLENLENDDFKLSTSKQGQGKATVENFVDPKDLTEQQRGIAEIGEQLGVPVVFFKGDKELNGAHANGITYINVDSPVNPRWIFWHESGHWLKAQHPELMNDIIDNLDITDKQIEDFRERTGRYDLTDDEVREEIFADNMFDADKRIDILQALGKKDASLLDRLVSWLKSIMDRVTSYFNTPKYGLTNTQKNQMFAELGKAFRAIREADGKSPRYRYGNTTHVVQYADGRELPSVEDSRHYSFAGTKALTANQKALAKAKRMEKSGKSRDEIFNDTGWVKGRDGKWRFEIPDNLDGIDFYELTIFPDSYLGNIYDNPKLYQAYPELRDVEIHVSDLSALHAGAYVKDGNITFDKEHLKKDPEKAKKSLMHEVQHLIQDIEEFAHGGDNRTVRRKLIDNMDKIVTEAEKIPGGDGYLHYLLGLAKGNGKDRLYENKVQTEMPEKSRKKIETLSKRYIELQNAWSSKSDTDVDLYWRLGGEQEARENERRSELHTNIAQAQEEYEEARDRFEKAKKNATKTQLAILQKHEDKNYTGRTLKLERLDELEEELGEKLFAAYNDYLEANKKLKVAQKNLPYPTIHNEAALIIFHGKKYAMASARLPENSLDNYNTINENENKNISEVNGDDETTDVKTDSLHFSEDRGTTVKRVSTVQKDEGDNRQGGIYKTSKRTKGTVSEKTQTGDREDVRPSPQLQMADDEEEDFDPYAPHYPSVENKKTVKFITNLIEREDIEVITDWDEVRRKWLSFPESKGDEYPPPGFMYGGKIYINVHHNAFAAVKDFDIETPIHEYTHVWDIVIAVLDPKLWQRGVEIMKQSPDWERVRKIYIDAGKPWAVADEFSHATEVHARIAGELGTKIFGKNEGYLAKFARWAREFWRSLKHIFERNMYGEVKSMSLEEFAKMPIKHLKFGMGMGKFYKNIYGTSNKQSVQPILDKNTVKYSIGDSSSGNNNSSSSEGIIQKIKSLLPIREKTERTDRQRKRERVALEKLSNLKIAAGHLKPGTDSIFKELEKVIRTRNAYDWGKVLPIVGRETAKQLGIEPTDKMNSYIADWILDGAPNNQSAEAKTFQKAMRDNPDMAEILEETRAIFQESLNMTPAERISSRISDTASDKSYLRQVLDADFYEEWVDDLAPVKNLMDKIQEISGQKIPDSINAYDEFRLYKGRENLGELFIAPTDKQGAIAKKLKEKFPDLQIPNNDAEAALLVLKARFPLIDFTGFKTIHMILDEAGGKKNLKAFSTYCAAKQVKDIHNHNRKNPEKFMETPFSEEDCDATIAEGKAKFDQAQKDLVRYSKLMLEMMYRSGLLSKNNYQKIKNKWLNYVPLYRVFDENENIGFGDPLQRMKGSTRDIIDPVQSILHDTFEYVSRAEKNLAKCHLANAARCGGVGKIIEVVEDKKPDVHKTVTFYENGVKKYIEFDDEAVVRAINTIDTRQQASQIIKLLNIATSVWRSIQTAINVDFAAGNPLRDVPDAYLHNKYGTYGKYNPLNAITMIGDVIKGFGARMFKTQDYYEWLAYGGGQSMFISQDRNITKSTIDDMTKSEWEKWFKSGWSGPFERILTGLQYISEISEAGTRIAVYNRTKKALATKNEDGQATWADKRRAAFQSRDIIDFARGGRSSRSMSKGVAFFNATLQGIDRTCRTFNPKKLKRFGGTKESDSEFKNAIFRMALLGVLPAIVLFAINHREPWWKRQPNWLKEQNWLISEHVKIPKGMDFSIRLASTLTEQFLSSWVDKNPVDAARFFEPFKGAAPSLTSTIFTPIVENMANYSFFTQTPIVNQSYKNMPDHLQYNAYTSTLAKKMGEVTGFSPMKIDHLIYGYLGTIGRMALQNRPLGWSADTLPMVRRFFYDPMKNPKAISDYYDALDKQTALYHEYKETKQKPKNFDPALYKRLTKTSDDMSKYSKLERKIISDPKLSIEQRRKQVTDLQERRLKLIEKVLQR